MWAARTRVAWILLFTSIGCGLALHRPQGQAQLALHQTQDGPRLRHTSVAEYPWIPRAVDEARRQEVDATIAALSKLEQQQLAGDPTVQPPPFRVFSTNAIDAAVPDDRWAAWNSSERVPLLPRALAWLIYEAESESANRTSGVDFDVGKATTLAQYTSVVYCTEDSIRAWNCSRCRTAGPLTVYNVVFDAVWDLTAFAGWSSKLGAKLIVFRGTDSHSLYNWVENMHYWRTDFSIPFPNATGALVHTGFVASYNQSTLRANLTEAMKSMQRWHPWAPLYVVGHSLGGALATLCALDMKFTFKLKDVRVYTFGSPRVGNKEFVDYFDWQVQESFRMTHNRDIVPSVPLQIMGFRHVPREVWQVDFAGHSALTVCNDGGEDPRCHDSMCYLGLCTSVADHLVYLGAHMYHSDAGC